MHLIKRFFGKLERQIHLHRSLNGTSLFKTIVIMVKRLFHVKGIYRVVIADYPAQMESVEIIHKVDIRMAQNRKEILAISSIPGCIHPSSFFLRLYDHHTLFWLAYKNNQLVGFICASPSKNLSLLTIRLKMNPQEIYLHNLLVDSNFRNHKIGFQLYEKAFEDTFKMNYKQAFGLIIDGNKSMEKLSAKFGFKVRGKLIHQRILFWNVYSQENHEKAASLLN